MLEHLGFLLGCRIARRVPGWKLLAIASLAQSRLESMVEWLIFGSDVGEVRMPGRRSGRHGRRQQARGDARGFVLSARGGRLQWHCLKRRNVVSARSSGVDPCCPTAADALDAAENGCRSARRADCAIVQGFPKNRERGNRQLLHSMWLLKPAAGRTE